MADPALRYEIAFPRPQTHLYEVALEISDLSPGEHRLEMAVWTPGSYLVREYSGHVHDMRMEDEAGRPIAFERAGKNAWRFTAGGRARVRYSVYANELTVDTSHLDDSHAYWNGASLFLCLDGRQELGAQIDVTAPAGWRVATGMDWAQTGPGRFRLTAADFDTLLDCPVEVGAHRAYAFEALGRPHEVAVYGHGNEDAERLVADLRRLVETAGAIFGGLPYERYVFIVHLCEHGGGLEHLNSTTCDVGRFDFRPESSYLQILWLFSHEYFHLWNVKRIHPEALGPFDYGRENYTTLLWAMEGVTDYYANLVLERAGLWSERKYMQVLAGEIRDYELHPGRLAQSASASSYDSWVKFYRPDESSPNHTISYYTKGGLLGLCLDLEIRARTGGRASLDDVLRRLFERYGARGVGFPEAAYRQTVEEVAGSSFADFWAAYVDGVEEIDFGRFLGRAALNLERRVQRGAEDGDEANRAVDAPEVKDAQGAPRAGLGLVPTVREGRLQARYVLRGGAAEDAGLYADDEILAVDGYRVTDAAQLLARVRDHQPGETARILVSRRGVLEERTATLATAPPDLYRIAVDPAASNEARAIHKGWLGTDLPAADGLAAEPAPLPRGLRDLV